MQPIDIFWVQEKSYICLVAYQHDSTNFICCYPYSKANKKKQYTRIVDFSFKSDGETISVINTHGAQFDYNIREQENSVIVKRNKQFYTHLEEHFTRMKYSSNNNLVAFYNEKNLALFKTKDLIKIPKNVTNYLDLDCRYGYSIDNYFYKKEYWVYISRNNNLTCELDQKEINSEKMETEPNCKIIELFCEKGDSSGNTVRNRIRIEFDENTKMTYSMDGLHVIVWNIKTCEIFSRNFFKDKLFTKAIRNLICKGGSSNIDCKTIVSKNDSRQNVLENKVLVKLDCCKGGKHIVFAVKSNSMSYIYIVYKGKKLDKNAEKKLSENTTINIEEKYKMKLITEIKNAEILSIKVYEVLIFIVLHTKDSILIKKFEYENLDNIQQLTSLKLSDINIMKNICPNEFKNRPFYRYNTKGRRFSSCKFENGETLTNPSQKKYPDNCLLKYYHNMNEIDKEDNSTRFNYSEDFKIMIAWHPTKFIKVVCMHEFSGKTLGKFFYFN